MPEPVIIVIPLLLAIAVNQTFIANKGADALSRAATISLSTNDGSVNQRLRYYQDVLTHMTSNPILGVGLGNWKLKSIDYDSTISIRNEYDFKYKIDDLKSIAYVSDFDLKDGSSLRVWCVNWSKVTEKKRNFNDNLSVAISPNYFLKWRGKRVC